MTNDHRTDIRDAAESDTADVRAIVRAMATGEPYTDPYTGEDRDPYDVMGETFLAVEVWAPLGDGSARAADLDRARVEFLLGVGGPTVSVLVDLGRDAVTYRHSWGRDARGEDCHELDLWADDDRGGNAGPWAPEAGPGAPWLTLARDVVDGYR